MEQTSSFVTVFTGSKIWGKGRAKTRAKPAFGTELQLSSRLHSQKVKNEEESLKPLHRDYHSCLLMACLHMPRKKWFSLSE